MKKMIFVILASILMAGCVEADFAKDFGGKMTVELPKGEKLLEATWKNSNIWYLTEPMDSTYVPKRKVLREKSCYGQLEGEVTFIESR